MGFFDERVLTALKDGKPRGFTVLLGEVGFSHNILQQHLKRLMAQGLIVREKAAANSFGRPKFASKSNFNWSLSQMYDNKITPARVLVHKQFLRFFAQLETFRIRTSQLLEKSTLSLILRNLLKNSNIIWNIYPIRVRIASYKEEIDISTTTDQAVQ